MNGCARSVASCHKNLQAIDGKELDDHVKKSTYSPSLGRLACSAWGDIDIHGTRDMAGVLLLVLGATVEALAVAIKRRDQP